MSKWNKLEIAWDAITKTKITAEKIALKKLKKTILNELPKSKKLLWKIIVNRRFKEIPRYKKEIEDVREVKINLKKIRKELNDLLNQTKKRIELLKNMNKNTKIYSFRNFEISDLKNKIDAKINDSEAFIAKANLEIKDVEDEVKHQEFLKKYLQWIKTWEHTHLHLNNERNKDKNKTYFSKKFNKQTVEQIPSLIWKKVKTLRRVTKRMSNPNVLSEHSAYNDVLSWWFFYINYKWENIIVAIKKQTNYFLVTSIYPTNIKYSEAKNKSNILNSYELMRI